MYLVGEVRRVEANRILICVIAETKRGYFEVRVGGAHSVRVKEASQDCDDAVGSLLSNKSGHEDRGAW